MDGLSKKHTALMVLTALVILSLFFPFFSRVDTGGHYSFDSLPNIDCSDIEEISLFDIVKISYAYQGKEPAGYYENQRQTMLLNLFFSCCIIFVAIIQFSIACSMKGDPGVNKDKAEYPHIIMYSSLAIILFLWILQLKMDGFTELSYGYSWGSGFFICCILSIAVNRVSKHLYDEYAYFISETDGDSNQSVQPGDRNPKQNQSSRQWICTCGKSHEYYVSSCSCGCNRRDITSNK